MHFYSLTIHILFLWNKFFVLTFICSHFHLHYSHYLCSCSELLLLSFQILSVMRVWNVWLELLATQHLKKGCSLELPYSDQGCILLMTYPTFYRHNKGFLLDDQHQDQKGVAGNTVQVYSCPCLWVCFVTWQPRQHVFLNRQL